MWPGSCCLGPLVQMRWMMMVSSSMIYHSYVLYGEVMDARTDVYTSPFNNNFVILIFLVVRLPEK